MEYVKKTSSIGIVTETTQSEIDTNILFKKKKMIENQILELNSQLDDINKTLKDLELIGVKPDILY